MSANMISGLLKGGNGSLQGKDGVKEKRKSGGGSRKNRKILPCIFQVG